VSVASAVRWSQRQRRTGRVAPGKQGGHRKPILLPEREWLLTRMAAEPDLTLRGLLAELAERGVKAPCGCSSIARVCRSKKSLFASEQDRPKIARRRAQWKKYQGRLDPKRLVFIDESRTACPCSGGAWDREEAKTNMTRTHGRALKGRWLHAKAPFGKWRTLTFVAALRHDRIDAPCVIDGPINGELFTAWSSSSSCPPSRQATSSSWTPR
jgi:hypothetical protein